jgi:hypothetical protein
MLNAWPAMVPVVVHSHPSFLRGELRTLLPQIVNGQSSPLKNQLMFVSVYPVCQLLQGLTGFAFYLPDHNWLSTIDLADNIVYHDARSVIL